MTRLSQAQSMDSSGSHMRISDEQYFRSCVAKERHLAQLLGYQAIEENYESAGTLWAGAQVLPQWTRDWGACGPLLAKHRIAITFEPATATSEEDDAGNPGVAWAGKTRVALSDHPSPDRALMVAVVREIIRLLEHPHSARPEQAAPLHPHP